MYLAIITGFILIAQCFCGVPWVGESKDKNWWNHHEALLNQTEAHREDIKLVFLGDSITFGWLNQGKQYWVNYYSKPRHAYNYGIGGDRTENVIFRIENKEFDGVKPKVVVLMIGTNNLNTNTAEDIAKGVKEINRLIEAKMPMAKILLISVLPKTGKGSKVEAINKIISGFEDKKKVFYVDLMSHFQTGLDKEVAQLYLPDRTHPNTKGYEMWHKVMEPTLKTLLGEH